MLMKILRKLTLMLVGTIAITSLWLSVPQAVRADTFTVTLTTDLTDADLTDNRCDTMTSTAGDQCSLRAAVQQANALTETASVIVLPAGVYVLTLVGEDITANAGDLDITGSIIINGAGMTSTIIDGGGIDRVFEVRSKESPINTVSISNLTVRNGALAGANSGSGRGGGIYNEITELTLSGVAILNNSTAGSGNRFGGGIASGGPLTLIDCLVSGNVVSSTSDVAAGGGIASLSRGLILQNSVVSNNLATSGGFFTSFGGGISVVGFPFVGNPFSPPLVSIISSTITANRSIHAVDPTKGIAGGIGVGDTHVSMGIVNSTISGNTASGRSGGLEGGPASFTSLHKIALTHVTFVSNTAGIAGGINSEKPTALKNVLLAGNTSTNPTDPSPDCFGSLQSLGHNLILTTTGCVFTGDTATDIIGQPPKIGPLQNNGGRTATHALLAGSPAIDAGVCDAQVLTDQRGIARPYGAGCDIGAFELETTPTQTPTPTPIFNLTCYL